ncbi:MAG: helix-turn-helix domain-containing protein [Clostridia bacterium]|nr:helix-turn-helix domain-containing protein [Clostridia bacterium]
MSNIQLEHKIGMTVDEAAAYTSIGRNTLRFLINNEKLPVLRVGRRIIIRIDVLDRFLTKNQDINLLDLDKVMRIS